MAKERLFRLAIRASTIQFGYKKLGIHARSLPQTLEHGTARMKLDKGKEYGGKKRGVSMGRSKVVTKKEVPTVHHYLIKIQY